MGTEGPLRSIDRLAGGVRYQRGRFRPGVRPASGLASAGMGSGIAIPVVCRDTTDELLRVLGYPKFRLSATERRILLEDYLPFAEVASATGVAAVLPMNIRDRDDAAFLRLALATRVPLVSGDADLTVLRDLAPIPIWSVAELQHRLSE